MGAREAAALLRELADESQAGDYIELQEAEQRGWARAEGCFQAQLSAAQEREGVLREALLKLQNVDCPDPWEANLERINIARAALQSTDAKPEEVANG